MRRRPEFEQELAIDPTNANAAYELGELERKAGRSSRPAISFARAVASQPAFEHARVGLARVLLALDQPAEALPHLRAVLQDHPDNEVALYQLAQACRRLGDTDGQREALAAFTQARTRSRGQPASLVPTQRDATPQVLDSGAPPP